VPLALVHEVGDGAAIGAARVGVADVGGEELDEVVGGALAGVHDHSRQLGNDARRQGQAPTGCALRYDCRVRQKLGVHELKYNGGRGEDALKVRIVKKGGFVLHRLKSEKCGIDAALSDERTRVLNSLRFWSV
jgi:hypothetical protein